MRLAPYLGAWWAEPEPSVTNDGVGSNHVRRPRFVAGSPCLRPKLVGGPTFSCIVGQPEGWIVMREVRAERMSRYDERRNQR